MERIAFTPVQSLCGGSDPSSRQWVHILPKGTISARDGRTFCLSRPEQVIAKTLEWAKTADIPVDYEHQTDLAKTNGQPAPAAGWVKKLEVRENGIWALIEWTERAAAMIARKEYRYVSPTIMTERETGEIAFIRSVALVNVPALMMTALTKSELSAMNGMEMEMVRKSLGLTDDADQNEIIAAITALRQELENATRKLKEIEPKSLSAMTGALEILSAERAAARRTHVKTKVENAIRDGVIVPAMQEWAIELCSSNETSFDHFTKSVGRPFAGLFEPVITPEMEARLNASIESDSIFDDSDANRIASQLGIDPKQMKS